MQGSSTCVHTTWPGGVLTEPNPAPFLHHVCTQRSAGQWVFSRPREKPLFCAAPAGWLKGFLTFLLWELFRAEATPGLRKQRGVEAFHTEGVGLFPMEKVYVAQPPHPHPTPTHPQLEACGLTPFCPAHGKYKEAYTIWAVW